MRRVLWILVLMFAVCAVGCGAAQAEKGHAAAKALPEMGQAEMGQAAKAQAAVGKEGILLVAFGTTVPESKTSLDAIGTAYAAQGKPVLWAYTSDIIRRKLEKQGKSVLSVNAALNKAADMGITDLRVQSLHVTAAEEFHQLERMLVKNITRQPGRFKTLFLGHPLLESERDMQDVMTAVLSEFPKDRQPGDAIVFMGHGNDRGPGDLVLYAVNKALQDKDPLAYVAAVEGSSTFDRVLEQLKAKGVQRVWLQPLMIVAGDHARNDMAGPEADSWASQLKAAGMQPLPHLVGLGEIKGIQAVFLRHTEDTTDDVANSKKSD